jgi:hypothetical protein
VKVYKGLFFSDLQAENGPNLAAAEGHQMGEFARLGDFTLLSSKTRRQGEL